MNGKIGLTELIFIMAIVLLIFGPSKIGQLGKSLGEGIRNFKSSVKEEEPKKEEEEKKS
ncbi:MAG: twin-arginine translocase TatA/TatE family subunit [Candidatus Sulfotelmatobacter sp.]|jgi:sec-independent protein translocase protein TatA